MYKLVLICWFQTKGFKIEYMCMIQTNAMNNIHWDVIDLFWFGISLNINTRPRGRNLYTEKETK